MNDRLAPETIQRLAPHVPVGALIAMRVVQGAPWRWIPSLFGMRATTFGKYVCFSQGAYDPTSARGLALIAHEALHIEQYREMGMLKFMFRYVVGSVRSGFNHATHPMEAPLIARQREIRRALNG